MGRTAMHPADPVDASIKGDMHVWQALARSSRAECQPIKRDMQLNDEAYMSSPDPSCSISEISIGSMFK